MRLSNVKVGDVVEVHKKGRSFHALVEDTCNGFLKVRPFNRSFASTYRTATAREVIGIWHQSKATAEAPLDVGGES